LPNASSPSPVDVTGSAMDSDAATTPLTMEGPENPAVLNGCNSANGTGGIRHLTAPHHELGHADSGVLQVSPYFVITQSSCIPHLFPSLHLLPNWMLDWFGLADPRVLQLMEALPGAEGCSEYVPGELRSGGWAGEAKRLERDRSKHARQGQQASKKVEAKEKRLESKLEKDAQKQAANQERARQRAELRAEQKRIKDQAKAEAKKEAQRVAAAAVPSDAALSANPAMPPTDGCTPVSPGGTPQLPPGLYPSMDGLAGPGAEAAPRVTASKKGNMPMKRARPAGIPNDAVLAADGVPKPAKKRRSAGASAAAAAAAQENGKSREEQEVEKVVLKLLDKVDKAVERDEKKEARVQQRQAEIEQRRQDKAAAKAEQDRLKEEQRQQAQLSSAHDAAQVAPVAHLGWGLEDLDLPTANATPPTLTPVGSGKLPPELISGLLEAWEFVVRFWEPLDLEPCSLEELETGLAEPTSSSSEMLTGLVMSIVDKLAYEAFWAALDVGSQNSSDMLTKELEPAYRSPTASTWQETARRYTALASLANLVTVAGTSGGLDVALGPNVGSTPLSVLGTQIVLQFLTSGVLPDPRKSVAALPLDLCENAPDAQLAAHTAAAGLAACKRLAASAEAMEDGEKQEARRRGCRKVLLALSRLQGPKDASGSKSDCKAISFAGLEAAAAARSALPLDLLTISRQADAGLYSVTAQGPAAFAADIRHVCDLFTTASKRPQSDFAASLTSIQAPAIASLVESNLDALVADHLSEDALAKDIAEYKQLEVRLAERAEHSRHGIANVEMDGEDEGGNEEAGPNEDSDGGETGPKAMQRPFAPWEGCCVCWADEDRARILLCDSCDGEYHLYCLEPPLSEAPPGNWYCPQCAQERAAAGKPPAADEGAILAAPGDLLGRSRVDPDQYHLIANTLGSKEWVEMEPQERLQILLLLLGFLNNSRAVRDLLLEDEEKRKDMRREVAAIRAHRAQLRKEEQEERERQEKQAAAAKAERQAAAAAAGEAGQDTPAEEAGAARAPIPEATGPKADDDAAAGAEGHAHTREQRARGRPRAVEKSVDPNADEDKVAELQAAHRLSELRHQAALLGYDRFWHRYWLMAGTTPQSPCCVYVEHRPHTLQLDSRQLGTEAVKGEDPVSLCGAVDHAEWGHYPTVAKVDQLLAYLNPRGAREAALRKSIIQTTEAAAQPSGQDVDMQDADGKPSMAEQIRGEVRRLLERLPPDALQPSDWAPPTELAWHTLLTSATSPRDFACILLALEAAVRPDRLKPWWRLWCSPLPHPSLTGTWACVKLRLEAMRAAIRHGTLPAVKDRAAAGRANPKHLTVKGYGAEGLQGSRAGGNAGAEGLQASRANGTASAADTGSEMDDEGSEGGGAVKRRAVKRRLERWKAEATPKPAKKAARESDEAMARRLQAELNDELAGRRSRLHRTKPQPETQTNAREARLARRARGDGGTRRTRSGRGTRVSLMTKIIR
ncbi:hypothetical protein WJX84_007928, partial [Apatococcus fuscideae]